MKKIFLLFCAAAVLTGCATYNFGQYNGKSYRLDTPVKTKEEATAAAKIKYEAEEKAAKEEAKNKFDKALQALLTEKCNTDKWTGYEIAASFAKAEALNLTPYKLMWATAYETRNLPEEFAAFQITARDMGVRLIKNYTNQEVSYGYYNILKTLSAEQEKVFNSIVERYNQCYEELK